MSLSSFLILLQSSFVLLLLYVSLLRCSYGSSWLSGIWRLAFLGEAWFLFPNFASHSLEFVFGLLYWFSLDMGLIYMETSDNNDDNKFLFTRHLSSHWLSSSGSRDSLLLAFSVEICEMFYYMDYVLCKLRELLGLLYFFADHFNFI